MTQNLQDGLVPFMAMFNKLQFLKDILSNTEAYGDFEVIALQISIAQQLIIFIAGIYIYEIRFCLQECRFK